MNRKERRKLERQKLFTDDAKVEEAKPKSRKKQVIFSLILVLAVAFIIFSYLRDQQPGEYDDFVACLAEKDVKFYGSFQCSHCQKQKKLFGRSSKTLDETGVYVECGPLGNFNSRCSFDKVSVVPLWKIGDEEILGKQQLNLLSKKSGCSLPNEPS